MSNTQGPWFAEPFPTPSNRNQWCVRIPQSRSLVLSSKRDARLISAAPEMLAALLAVREAGDQYWSDAFTIAQCQAKVAIAKAQATP